MEKFASSKLRSDPTTHPKGELLAVGKFIESYKLEMNPKSQDLM